ncbi:transmembrane protein 186 isoform 2-T2 [Fundulus diaphanus]
MLQSCWGTLAPKVTSCVRYSDLSTQKYSIIYTLPHIKLLRAISRLKLLQTAITVVILPPVYILYFQGGASSFLVGYSTGIALFAGVMLYAASHLFRRVVGMMYLDPSRTTLKVSHLSFWGKRQDVYLRVSDVMTIGDTGDSATETILKLKRYSSPETFYFSTRFGRIVDKDGFEKVFGSLK